MGYLINGFTLYKLRSVCQIAPKCFFHNLPVWPNIGVSNLMHTIFKGILVIPRSAKRSILIAADSLLLIGALWLSFSLRLDNWYCPVEA